MDSNYEKLKQSIPCFDEIIMLNNLKKQYRTFDNERFEFCIYLEQTIEYIKLQIQLHPDIENGGGMHNTFKVKINDFNYRINKLYSRINFTSTKVKNLFIELLDTIKQDIIRYKLQPNKQMKQKIIECNSFWDNLPLNLQVKSLLNERNYSTDVFPEEMKPVKLYLSQPEENNDVYLTRRNDNLYIVKRNEIEDEYYKWSDKNEDEQLNYSPMMKKTITNINDKNDGYCYLITEWDYYIW
jgi:hypothetical protein